MASLQVIKKGKLITRHLLEAGASTVHWPQVQNWLTTRVCKRCLDPEVFPRRYYRRPIWRTGTYFLCDPYQFAHWRPYWFGRLDNIEIDDLMRSTLRVGDTFIDVGANCGQYSCLASYLVGDTGSVIACEPAPKMLSLLRTQLRTQKLRNLEILPYALGSQSTPVSLHVNLDSPGRTSCLEHSCSDGTQWMTEQVEMRTGDELFRDLDFRGHVMLKMDVEGHEIAALEGMRETLSRHVDVAIVEVTPEWIGGGSGYDKLTHIMKDAGFADGERLRSGNYRIPAEQTSEDQQNDVVFRKSQRRSFAVGSVPYFRAAAAKSTLKNRFVTLMQNWRACSRRRRLDAEVGAYIEKCQELQAVFVHVPRTGGKSIIVSIYEMNEHHGPGHANASFFRAVLGPTRWANYFKFAFIRDPWERLHSAFRFAKNGGFGFAEDLFIQKEIGTRDFCEFVDLLKSSEPLRQSVIFRDQASFVCDDCDKVEVDTLLRFDRFAEEYENLSRRLNVNAQMPRTNVAPLDSHPDVTEGYRRATLAKVQDIYARDYDMLRQYFGNWP